MSTADYGPSLAADPPSEAAMPLPATNAELHFYSGPLAGGTDYELRVGNFSRGESYRLDLTL